MKFAYARVSSQGQNLERQIEAFLKEGVDERNIYTDKASGKDTNRDNYQLLTRRLLRESDCLLVDSLDRLGRSYMDLKNEWHYLTKELKCRIKVLDFPLLDTTTNNDLTNQLIVDIVFSLLCYIAERERKKILERQRGGIDVCLAHQGEPNVKHYGRPIVDFPKNYIFVIKRWENGEIRGRTAREELGLKKTTFYKLYKEYKEMNDEEKAKIGSS